MLLLSHCLTAVEKLLECPVCLDTLSASRQVVTCPNQHWLCRPCHDRLPARNRDDGEPDILMEIFLPSS